MGRIDTTTCSCPEYRELYLVRVSNSEQTFLLRIDIKVISEQRETWEANMRFRR